MPPYIRTYIHRSGRTARAGKTGKVITLLTNDQITPFKILRRKIFCPNKLKREKIEEQEIEKIVNIVF